MTIVLVNLLKVVRAMKVLVQLGPTGPTGAIVPLTVMGVSNREPGIVSMVQKVIVPEMILTNKNAIDNRVQTLGL